jgi:hypothetical protein
MPVEERLCCIHEDCVHKGAPLVFALADTITIPDGHVIAQYSESFQMPSALRAVDGVYPDGSFRLYPCGHRRAPMMRIHPAECLFDWSE